MLLTFDVGNTETTIGLFDGDQLRAHWRIMTDVARSADELGVLLRGLLAGATGSRPSPCRSSTRARPFRSPSR
jgi:type III pantothenate kinase